MWTLSGCVTPEPPVPPTARDPTKAPAQPYARAVGYEEWLRTCQPQWLTTVGQCVQEGMAHRRP